MNTKKILDSVFEGHNLTTVIWNNNIAWLASEISLALGYSKPGRISTLVSNKWNDDFVDGKDFIVLTGDRFQKFVRFDDLRKGSSNRLSKKARRTMLLTESGLNLVIINTRKPVGVRLRRHISSVVLPQLRREMIKERPARELEARYRKEILRLKDKLIERDEQIICFSEKLIEAHSKLANANYVLGAIGEARAAVCQSASLAGQSLQAHRKTKKLRDMN